MEKHKVKSGSFADQRQTYQPEVQPDFGVDFHTHSDAPIHYQRRFQAGNHLHDIIYLSSYIHDALCRLDELRLRRKTLSIPLNRARWERYRDLNDLVYIRSELTISSVVCLQLELNDHRLLQKKFLHEPEMIISKLQTISERWEDSDDEELIIDFVRGSKLRLRVGCEFVVRLVDLPAGKSSASRRIGRSSTGNGLENS